MIAFLRFVRVMNAAVWFGAAIFFTFGVGPAFFSAEMATYLSRPYAGLAAQVVIERFFYLHYICGGIAMLEMLVSWLYSGRPAPRLVMWVLIGIVMLGLIGGLVIQPFLHQQHLIKYGTRSTPEQRAVAAKTFGMWHGISQFANLFMLGGLFFFNWRAVNSGDGTRFASTAKFRG